MLLIIKYNQQQDWQVGMTIVILFLNQKQKTYLHLLSSMMLKIKDIELQQPSIEQFQYL